jgi:hypothetical protein
MRDKSKAHSGEHAGLAGDLGKGADHSSLPGPVEFMTDWTAYF